MKYSMPMRNIETQIIEDDVLFDVVITNEKIPWQYSLQAKGYETKWVLKEYFDWLVKTNKIKEVKDEV